MTLALLVTLAALLGATCAVVSWAHVRRIARAAASDPAALSIALRKVPEATRAHELLRTAAPSSWEHQLATEVIEAHTTRAKIAVVNAALAEVEQSVLIGSSWPSACVRIALFGGLFVGATTYLATADLAWALVIVSIGAVSSGICLEAKSRAQRHAIALRKAIDDLIDVLLGRLIADDESAPLGRRPRRRQGR